MVLSLDFLPPLAILLLNGAATVALVPRLHQLPHRGVALVLAIAPAVYALGVLVALALGVPGEPWRPGLAGAALGTFAVPAALAATVVPRRTVLLLLGCAALAWVVVWVRLPWSREWTGLGRAIAGYVLLCTAVSLVGLQRGDGGGLARRVHVLALPMVALGSAWMLLKPAEARQPILSTALLVADEAALLALIDGRLGPAAPPGRFMRGIEVLLVALGALLILTVAVNLRLFPRADAPLLVAVLVATLTAVGYAALRSSIEAWLGRALYPEAQAAAARIADLQGELEEARVRLREAEHAALVGQLAAQVAHEIKNPLGPIKGYAKIIARELDRLGVESEVLARGLGVIEEEVESIDARARGLLDLARPPHPTLEPLDLARLVADVSELARGDWPQSVELACDLPPGPLEVDADRLLLRSALLNALQNAAAACGGRGRVTVSLRAGAPHHEVRIEDEGPGLPSDLGAEGLFRPFASRREGGHGLGLVIARGALRAIGGELTLESRPEGGAVAILRIAARVPAPAPAMAPVEVTA